MTLTESGVSDCLGSASAKLKALDPGAATPGSLSTKKMAAIGHSSFNASPSFSNNVQLVINARKLHCRAISIRRSPGALASTGTQQAPVLRIPNMLTMAAGDL